MSMGTKSKPISGLQEKLATRLSLVEKICGKILDGIEDGKLDLDQAYSMLKNCEVNIRQSLDGCLYEKARRN